MSFQLIGLTAAPFTAFHSQGELNLAQIPRQAERLIRNGVNAAFVCGTTGEGASMTNEERRQVVEAWAAARGTLKLVVHVGHLCADDSCALAEHAQRVGADAIAAVAPSFFKPASVEALVSWCAKIAAAAPKLPFFYYHMPSMTGVRIPAADFLRLADGRIPSLAGVKFTYEDLDDYRAAREVAPARYDVLFGRDEILLSGLRLGATGAVGSTYNYAAPLYQRVIEAWRRGDVAGAERAQAKARAFIDVMNDAGGLPAGKVMMKLIGIDCGPVRLPLRRLSAQEEAALAERLEQVGFFEFASR